MQEYKVFPSSSVGDPCLGRSFVYDATEGTLESKKAFKTVWTQDMEDKVTVPITDITLSSDKIDEDLPASTVVGTLTISGGVLPASFQVTVGAANFKIDNTNELQTNISLSAGTYPVTIKATDVVGQTFTKVFSIIVANYVNEKSVLFDGVNEYVTMGDVHNFDIATAFSISLWVKPNNIASNRILFSKAGPSPNVIGYMLRQNEITGKLFMQLRPSGTKRSHTYDKSLTAGIWQHVVFTYAGGSNRSGAEVYLNASKATTPPAGTLSGSMVASQDFLLGQRTSNFYYSGNMDEVSIWDKELTQAEVTEIYNSGAPADLSQHSASANLTSWYRMGDDDTFPTLTDNVGSDDGTMTNMEAGDIEEDVP